MARHVSSIPSVGRTALAIALVSALAGALVVFWLGRQKPAPGVAARPAAAQPPAAAAAREPERLKVKVLASFKHDPTAYTQGLLWHDGKLYESTGLYGKSSLREVSPASGEVLRLLSLPAAYFGEGLALVGDQLIQLTWKEQTAFVYGRARFDQQGTFEYTGEGWGLCWDGRKLIMSDGSDRLTFRDPGTFAPLGGVNVTEGGKPVLDVNELECVDGAVWANVWQTDRILRIDPASGQVTAEADASGLLTPEEKAAAEVLNGIAWRPDTKTFYITGKNWPKMFEVVFE
jgi:glutaminyl-peptide cyclotransferase